MVKKNKSSKSVSNESVSKHKKLSDTKKSKSKKSDVDDTQLTNEQLSQDYQKKTQLQHIIDLPDTYIGSIETESSEQWIAVDDDSDDNGDSDDDSDGNSDKKNKKTDDKKTNDNVKIIQKEIEYPPGLMNIIEEILVNAYDNRNRVLQRKKEEGKRLSEVTKIEVTVNSKTGEISILNDGEGVPIAIHPEEKIYVPEMIFGHLLTSGNYKKDEKKITGGKNGYGAKLTNIYSKLFIVETANHRDKKKYVQEFKNNMKKKGKPTIESYSGKPYTKITFIPDYERFGMQLSSDIIALIRKRTLDMFACSNGEINVSFNGVKFAIKDFKDYIKLYIGNNPCCVFKTDRWAIGACLTPKFSFAQVSFVNGINTNKGGRHVDYITKQICDKLVVHIKKKNKVDVKSHVIKENLMVFVNSIIVNPSFDSQTKDTLTTPKTRFGSECEVPDTLIKEMESTGIIERAISLSEYQDKQSLSKTDGKKNTRILNIPKLDDARYAGTKNSSKCTLILTEGDSAKSMAVSGISIKSDADYYGIFPLKGKPLNTRDCTKTQYVENDEICNIKTILGLREGVDDINKLRYGRIMIMSDQDVDGSHIKGLLFNFMSRWPKLMKIDGFITSLLTPIVKVSKGKQVINFYTIPDYDKWLEDNNDGKGWKSKYYKGLATSTPKEAKEYFRDFKVVKYKWSENSEEKLDLAFNKKRPDDRKKWLTKYDRNATLSLDNKTVLYEEFIDKDMIHFSIDDLTRSVPNICDGFKPSQRKAMYSCFKRNLVSDIRVAQLAGYVSEHSAYHHGEASLYGTISGLAQRYTGKNNINLLKPEGQYGTRLVGGKDTGQPRYIETSLDPITFALFNKLDKPLYNYINDEGMLVEPEYYLPILPLILINGSDGIGTGWATKIPNFSPTDIIRNIRRLFNDEPIIEMTPWYRGFCGTIGKLKENSWYTRGNYNMVSGDTLEVTELPIGVWTEDFKNLLNDLMISDHVKSKKEREIEKKKKTNNKKQPQKKPGKPLIKDFVYKKHDTKVSFSITFADKDKLYDLMMKKDKDKFTDLEKLLRLKNKISCDNSLNAFDKNLKLKSFRSPEEILKCYYDVRLEYYAKRKKYHLANKINTLKMLSIRAQFILAIIAKEIKVNNIPKKVIAKQLISLKYPVYSDNVLMSYSEYKSTLDENDDDLSNKKISGYDYLLNMPIYNLTKEKVESLKKEKQDLQTEVNELEKKTPKDLWEEDLVVFEEEYSKHMKRYYKDMDYDPDNFPMSGHRVPRKKIIRGLKKKYSES